MESGGYPRLCGGTFFTLLPKALKQRRKARDRYNGGSDGLSYPDVLIGLIRVVQPTYLEPAASTFAQNTSAYKSCGLSSGTYLPFNDPSFTTPFDMLVKTNYNCALVRMAAFIDNFIDIGNTIKSENLVKSLLELIKADKSTDNATFYVNSGGKALSKEAVCAMTDICLQPFLLGVWHFIIMNRQDNGVGRATFEEWHEVPEMKGQQWRFISSIGEDPTRTVNVTVLNLTAPDAEQEAASSTEYDSSEKYEELFVDDSVGGTNSGTTNQTVNTPAVFINHGADCMQINNTGTLNIDRRRG